MAALAKHYIKEWEENPDLFAFELTCQYNGLAALRVAQMAANRFYFQMPKVVVNRRQWGKSTCLGTVHPGQNLHSAPQAVISMRGGFTAGEFLHELAHAWCFWVVGDHDHGETFRYYCDRLFFWFRLEEQAQAAFFP